MNIPPEQLQILQAQCDKDLTDLMERKVLIMPEFSPLDAVAIILAVQLAYKHPEFRKSRMALRARNAALHLQGFLSRTPALAHMLELGWNFLQTDSEGD